MYEKEDVVSTGVCQLGEWEISSPPVHVEAAQGKTFLDIGANLGWWSFIYAEAGYAVTAVEALEMNRELIKATMCANPDLAARITLVESAVSSKVGQCTIFSDSTNVGDGALACDEVQLKSYKEHVNRTYVQRGTVPLQLLDTVMAGKPPQGIVKMDVEGHEQDVIKGGQKTFGEAGQVVVELFGNADAIKAELQALKLQPSPTFVGKENGLFKKEAEPPSTPSLMHHKKKRKDGKKEKKFLLFSHKGKAGKHRKR